MPAVFATLPPTMSMASWSALSSPARIVERNVAPAARDQAAARLFAAYGVMPNGDDPLSKALHGLINQVAAQEQQLEAVLAALQGAGIGCRRLEEAGQFDAAQLNRLVD